MRLIKMEVRLGHSITHVFPIGPHPPHHKILLVHG